jgi:hypothetical protein
MYAYKPIPSNYKNITCAETVEYPLKGKCLFYAIASRMNKMWPGRDSIRLKNMVTELPVLKPLRLILENILLPGE